jgi:hypothetical protein
MSVFCTAHLWQPADTLRVDGRVGRVVAERSDGLRLILLPRLEPYRQPIGKRHGEAVVITSHTAQMSKVMIERAIFLHEHNDMLYVVDRAGNGVGFDRKRLTDRVRKERRCSAGTGQASRNFQKIAAALRDHALTFFVFYGE